MVDDILCIANCAIPKHHLDLLASAVLRTVAYADVFDYPLTVTEVHRYLIGVRAVLAHVVCALRSKCPGRPGLVETQGFVTLPGRESIVETRLRRQREAARLWPRAVRYGRLLGGMPFVRMVAVTGALAVDNVERDADIDYLIVTTPGRLWLVRSLSIALVHAGRVRGVTVCPNYLVSLDALEQLDRSLFTAHELAQMKLVYGPDIHDALLCANGWALRFLPNAFSEARPAEVMPSSWRARTLKRAAEGVLSGRLGEAWELRERRIKIRRLSGQAGGEDGRSAEFSPQRCKGHIDSHSSPIHQAYVQRLERLGLVTDQ